MQQVKLLYDRLRALPCPSLAKGVGDFVLYDSLLAGCADTDARGRLLDLSKVPAPDSETVEFVTSLRRKYDLSKVGNGSISLIFLLKVSKVGTLTFERGG